jgi:hypothetical protein
MPTKNLGNLTPLPPDDHPFQAQRPGDVTAGHRRRRSGRWVTITVVAVIAAGTVWAIVRWTAQRIEESDIVAASLRQPALPGFPVESPAVYQNNVNAKFGRVPNLDGKAIPYAKQANGLVVGGEVRSDRPLAELAAILEVTHDSIADPRSHGQVDSDAPLFVAQTAILTEKAKEISRTMRIRQLREGKAPDAVFPEWIVMRFTFTRNRLKHPNDEEKIVLAAIVRAATPGFMPQPGDETRAVPLNRGELGPDRTAAAAGYLPSQTREQAAKQLLARP